MASKLTGKKISSIRFCKNKVVLYLHGEKLDVSKEIYSSMYLFKGKEIDEKTYVLLKQSLNEETYIKYALKLLAKRYYSIHQMREKLTKKGASSHMVNKVIKYLKENKLLDDNSLAIMYIDNLSSLFYGRNRIKRKLMEKGIDYDVVDSYLSKEDEINKCKMYYPTMNKKFASLPNNKKRTSIMTHLINRGYDIDVINSVLRECFIYTKEDNSTSLEKEFRKAFRAYNAKYDNDYNVNKHVIDKLKRMGYKYADIKRVMEESENDFN